VKYLLQKIHMNQCRTTFCSSGSIHLDKFTILFTIPALLGEYLIIKQSEEVLLYSCAPTAPCPEYDIFGHDSRMIIWF